MARALARTRGEPRPSPWCGQEARFAFQLCTELVREGGLRYLWFVLISISCGLAWLLPAQLLRWFTAHAARLDPGTLKSFLWSMSLRGAGIALLLFASILTSTLAREWFRLSIESELRLRVMRRIHRLPLSVLDSAQRGDWLTRMTGDLMQVEGFLTSAIPDQLQQAATGVGAAAILVKHSGPLSLIPLAAGLAMGVLNLRVQRRLAPVLGDLRSLHGRVVQRLIESLEGVRTIRAQSAEAEVEGRFEERLDEIRAKSMRMVRTLGALLGANELIGQVLITACLTAVGWALGQGRLGAADMLAYPFFLGMFCASVQRLTGAAYTWNRFLAEGGRLGQLLHGPGTPAVRTPVSDLPGAPVLVVRALIAGHEGSPVVGPLDLRLETGRLFGITGPSGCGKSTLLEVLSGLRPPLAGRALVTTAHRVDGATSTGADGAATAAGDGPVTGTTKVQPVAAGWCALVEQRTYIFEGTLRDNLLLGNRRAVTDTELWQRLGETGLTEFAASYGGLDHQLRDRGANLSEGERYRIALCRALLLGRPFLLLDEPFAALDPRSIEIIVDTLHREKRSKGVLVVTHHFPEQIRFDGIVELGPPTRGCGRGRP